MSQPVRSVARQVSVSGATAVAIVLLIVSLIVGAMLRRA
jgi:methyl-accepting chemotaxis protein-2 (aspartate sensor receptor)